MKMELMKEYLIEFEISEDISLFYSMTDKEWFIEDYDDNELIDLTEICPMEYKGFIITIEDVEYYKEKIKEEESKND